MREMLDQDGRKEGGREGGREEGKEGGREGECEDGVDWADVDAAGQAGAGARAQGLAALNLRTDLALSPSQPCHAATSTVARALTWNWTWSYQDRFITKLGNGTGKVRELSLSFTFILPRPGSTEQKIHHT